MNKHKENGGAVKERTHQDGDQDVKQDALSDSAKIVLLKRLLRADLSLPVLLLMMVSVIEPDVARRVYMKYAAEGIPKG